MEPDVLFENFLRQCRDQGWFARRIGAIRNKPLPSYRLRLVIEDVEATLNAVEIAEHPLPPNLALSVARASNANFVLAPKIGPVLSSQLRSMQINHADLAGRTHKTKDAEDIGTALTWLAESPSDEDYIYNNEFDLLVSNDFDLTLTMNELFGGHIAGLLEAPERARLLEKVHELEPEKFIGDLHRGLYRGSPPYKRNEAAQQFAALTKGLGS